MPGSASDPVRLDPWQDIIEVGWPSPEGNFGQGLFFELIRSQSPLASCSGGTEPFNVNDHSGTYYTNITLRRPPPTGPDTFDGSLTLASGETIPVTYSGFDVGPHSRDFGSWEVAQIASTSLFVTDWTVGTAVTAKLNNLDNLDGNPVCRTLLAGSRLSAGRTGLADVEMSVDFSGITATEIGGAGRVFVVSGAVIDGQSPASIGFTLMFTQQ